MDSQIVN